MLQVISKSSQKRFLTVLTLLMGLAWSPLMAHATTFTWDQSESTNWFDANNWTPVGVPGGGDTAILSGGTASIGNTSVSLAALNLSGGSVVGTGQLTLTGTSTITSGAYGCTINNNGTVNWPVGAGNINALPDSIFNNNGTFNAAANSNGNGIWAALSGGTGQQFNNIGTLNANAPVDTGYPIFGNGSNFKNAGTVHVIRNRLGIADGTSSGNFNCETNAFVLFSGNAHTLTGGARFTGAGKSLIHGAVVLNGSIVGGQSGGTLELSGGTLTSVTGGGTITGTLNLASGNVSGTINNNGIVNWPAGAGNINAQPDSIFNNNGTFNAAANSNGNGIWAAFTGGTGQQFNNIGTLNANAPVDTGYPIFGNGSNFKNTGTVHVISNRLGIADGTSSGIFNCDANAFVLFNGNTHTLTNGARCTGAGSTRIHSTVTISGTIVGGQSGGKLELSGGTLTTATTATITGTLLLSGGALGGALNANGTTNWPAGAGSIHALPGSIFNNNGTFNAGANSDWAAFTGGTGQQFNNRGLLNVDKPGTPGIYIPFMQSSTGTFDVDLGGTSAGSGYDLLEAGTPVTLGGALTVTATFAPAVGDAFTIIANDGSDAIVGTFAGLPQNATLKTNNLIFRISYTGGDGNDVVLTRLPHANLSINDITVTEGNTGTKNAVFTVSLSSPTPETVSVNAITANGTAKAPGDFTASGQTLTFAPNQLSKTFSVPIVGDTTDENNETFFVLLSSAANAGITRARGVGTINDDDAAPLITIDNLSIGEGNSGQRTAVFVLHLSQASGKAVKVNYATAVGTATAGNDYVAVAPTQITFNVGQTVTLARVLINGDLLTEPDETFLINLSAPVNGTIADNQAVGTILNDDSAPALSINDVSIAEGNSGTKTLTFTVSLSKASGQTVTVNYATADGVARSTSDYVAKSGSLSFAPGSALTRTISITINGDTAVEEDETFFVFLSGQTNASVSKARGIGTLTNDDISG